MSIKATAPSRLLGAVHDTAGDLHAAGFIDKRRMHEYAALCSEPIPEYSSKKIPALRARHKLSQAVLSSLLNTSASTARQWEIGEKRPSGPSVKPPELARSKGPGGVALSLSDFAGISLVKVIADAALLSTSLISLI